MRSKPSRGLGGAAALALLAALLAGCSVSDTSAAAPAALESEQSIGIAFSISPETPKANEKATLEAVVTRGGQPLEEAEVVFEIWPKGAAPENHAQLIAKAGADEGVYELKGEFAEAGTYYVVTHVTPGDTGVMTMASFDFQIQ